MTTVPQHVQALVEEDPGFARLLAESDGELRLAMQTARMREARGMTQLELATAAGMRQPAVARYEKAGRTPTISTLWRFATALNVEFRIGPNYAVAVTPLSDFELRLSVPTGSPGIVTGGRAGIPSTSTVCEYGWPRFSDESFGLQTAPYYVDRTAYVSVQSAARPDGPMAAMSVRAA